MATFLDIEVIVAQPDGTRIAHVREQDLTLNIDISDLDAEAPLALASFDRMIAELRPVIERRITDWATSIKAVHSRQEQAQRDASDAVRRALEEDRERPDED